MCHDWATWPGNVVGDVLAGLPPLSCQDTYELPAAHGGELPSAPGGEAGGGDGRAGSSGVDVSRSCEGLREAGRKRPKVDRQLLRPHLHPRCASPRRPSLAPAPHHKHHQLHQQPLQQSGWGARGAPATPLQAWLRAKRPAPPPLPHQWWARMDKGDVVVGEWGCGCKGLQGVERKDWWFKGLTFDGSGFMGLNPQRGSEGGKEKAC